MVGVVEEIVDGEVDCGREEEGMNREVGVV